MRTEISPTGTGRLPRELLAAAVEDRQCQMGSLAGVAQ